MREGKEEENRGSPSANGNQFTVQETHGTSGYLLSFSLFFLPVSPSLTFSICLSLRSCYTTLKGLEILTSFSVQHEACR